MKGSFYLCEGCGFEMSYSSFIPENCFPDERYESLRSTYRMWWKDRLERPIVPIITTGHPSPRKPSEYPLLAFPTAWDMSISPEKFVDAYDYHLSTLRWHGDAFPFFPITPFGPGVMAAFLGCTPVGVEHTVWFMPPKKDIPIEELHFSFDENNPYFRRVVNIVEAAMEKWRGHVVVGMVDIGGVMDVLSSFRGTENLLTDLYDSPDEVLRCVKELQELWLKYFRIFNDIMAPEARGYSQWYNLYGEQPGYILQSDFSYMISPDMFDKFVGPELASTSKHICNAVYHMDGIGEIPHLDSLLKIDSIKGIQWVPGDGEPSSRNWDELLDRILVSGKKLISWNQNPDGSAVSIAKNPGQLYFPDRYFSSNDTDAVKKYADMYGIEVKL